MGCSLWCWAQAKRYEDFFRWAAERHPQQVSAKIMFNNELAHQIMQQPISSSCPLLFEPCGLSQLMALRYGALPIVRETGGLKDSSAVLQRSDG